MYQAKTQHPYQLMNQCRMHVNKEILSLYCSVEPVSHSIIRKLSSHTYISCVFSFYMREKAFRMISSNMFSLCIFGWLGLLHRLPLVSWTCIN